ncbi:hypothetical protein UY3_12819 [Chelonia mydas]|uniref:Uncharacterized protein n=1 Tax=Chelonia mydas TaxID=8469 RepID=M7AZ75_CHEMY|nr:hypothetical protein UY3_12819 [Chelonia mydas]
MPSWLVLGLDFTPGDRCCCSRCSGCRFSGSNEDLLNQRHSALQYSGSPRRVSVDAAPLDSCSGNPPKVFHVPTFFVLWTVKFFHTTR